jgi:transcriptional regulator GlxA family with amidase domain
MRGETRRITLFIYDGFQSLDLSGPLEVFATANRLARGGAPPYALQIVAPAARPVTGISRVRIVPDATCQQVRGRVDTLIVAGGDVRAVIADHAVLRWLTGMSRRARRVASVCTGAFLLAEIGLLAKRRATTHWQAAHLLAERYPRVSVEPDAIFVRDGRVYTSAGVTAGIDLALALVEEDRGHAAALAVARQLVVFLKRPGGQSQFSSALAAQAAAPGPLKSLPEWIVEHLTDDLSVDALAGRAGMSARHFARVFRTELGVSPAKFVARARLDAARRWLEDGALGLEQVAARCGFASAEQMRRTFRRHLKVVPIDYRKRFHQRVAPAVAAPAPTTRRSA